MSNTKILVSGCGITFSRAALKTWPNILKLAGCDVIDVSGPAVSNQWIINKTFLTLYQSPDIKTVFLQLTNTGKLDVEVDSLRIKELVRPDPLRNFVLTDDFQVLSRQQITDSGIWPSSGSTHHKSKDYWKKWLYSPGLEKEDIYCKLILLDQFCTQQNINLHVYQGYKINWLTNEHLVLKNIIKNIDNDFYTEYLNSVHYKNHDHTQTVPCLGYQIELAQILSRELPTPVQDKVNKFKLMYVRS